MAEAQSPKKQESMDVEKNQPGLRRERAEGGREADRPVLDETQRRSERAKMLRMKNRSRSMR